MKIIKEGREQNGWAVETACTGKGNGGGGCGAELLVDQTDLHETSRSDYGGGRDVFATFQCPLCGVETDIDVPGNIQRELKPRRKVAEKPPIGKRNTPIAISVAGTSKIKIGAVTTVRDMRNMHAAVNGLHQSSSGVNEQPEGMNEILQGAWNRCFSAWTNDPRSEIYIGVENGIIQEPEGWFDIAVCAMFIPEYGYFRWVQSEACPFPTDAVDEARKIGFQTITVGKVMAEMDLVRKHDDPHIDLCGKHRSEILEDAISKLFEFIPEGVYLKRVGGDNA